MSMTDWLAIAAAAVMMASAMAYGWARIEYRRGARAYRRYLDRARTQDYLAFADLLRDDDRLRRLAALGVNREDAVAMATMVAAAGMTVEELEGLLTAWAEGRAHAD